MDECQLYSVLLELKLPWKVANVSLDSGKKTVEIARILAETIFTMLSRNMEFMDSIDSLTERKITAMSARAKTAANVTDISATVRLLKSQMFRRMSEEPFS